MKMTSFRFPLVRRLLVATGVLTVLGLLPLQAGILFSENMEASYYTDGAGLPTGWGQIHYGRWTDNSSGQGSATTVTDPAGGSGRVLAMWRGVNTTEPATTARARAIGILGETNEEATLTSDALLYRFSFYLQEEESGSTYFYGKNSEGSSTPILAYLQMVANPNGPYIRAQQHGGATSSIEISLETWYVVEVYLPANPSAGSTYSFSLYNSDQSTRLGGLDNIAFYNELDGPVQYAQFQVLTDSFSATTYFDDFHVETIPEPGALSLVILAFAAAAVYRLRPRVTVSM